MFVDLSMPIHEHTIVFPGDAAPHFEQAGNVKKDGFLDHVIHLNNHLGTHIDAPGHMIEGGKMLFEYGIDRFICDGIGIDARGRNTLTADLLDGIEVPSGTAVLFYTGSGDHYAKQTYATDYPAIDESLAARLIEKDVSMVGVDMISFDHDPPFPIHKMLLKKDILLIENLINLDAIDGKIFKLFALPVHFQLEAAPARVVAELPS